MRFCRGSGSDPLPLRRPERTLINACRGFESLSRPRLLISMHRQTDGSGPLEGNGLGRAQGPRKGGLAAAWPALEVVLMLGRLHQEAIGLADPGHGVAEPMIGSVDV